MRDSARAAFIGLTDRFEGCVPFMYLDVFGLVTTGRGNLIDEDTGDASADMTSALGLPFVRIVDGQPATRDEIAAEWRNVKAHQSLKLAGGMAFRRIATLELTQAGIDALTFGKLADIEAHLVKRWPGFPAFPADAQLACVSWAWAAGPACPAPHLDAALLCEPPDFATAATESHLGDAHNPGLRPRNVATADLFANAQRVLDLCAEPDTLYWPGQPAGSDSSPVASDDPTGPAA